MVWLGGAWLKELHVGQIEPQALIACVLATQNLQGSVVELELDNVAQTLLQRRRWRRRIAQWR